MNKEIKQKDWRPIWLYLLITIGTSFIVGIIYGFVAGIQGIEYDQTLLEPIMTVAADAIIMITFIIIYYKRLKTDIKRLNKKNIIYIIISAIILIIINEFISNLFTKLNIEMSNQNAIIDYVATLKIPMVITIIIMTPFIEEIVFRYSIRTLCKNNIRFIVISGIAFGLVHGLGIATLLYILISVYLSIVYLKNDENIIAPISVHFLNNLFAAIEVLLLLKK